MKRVFLAVATLALLVAIPLMSGCASGGAAAGVGEVIPGVPFPASYRVLVTPEGATEPVPAIHKLSITAPAVGTGQAFEFPIQPAGGLTTPGTVEVMTGRAPGTVPMLSGKTVTLNVSAVELASPAQFRGVVGYEASGAVLARAGTVRATFVTNADGSRSVTGTFCLTTESEQVPPSLRTYKGTFNGDLIVSPDDDANNGGGGGGSGPPLPPF